MAMDLPIIPINTRNNLYLWHYGEDGAERFAELFRQTWRQIPLGPRRAMLAHWRKMDSADAMLNQFIPPHKMMHARPGDRFTPDDGVRPIINYASGWNDDGDCPVPEGEHRVGVFGSCSRTGYVINFYAPRVREMPDDVVMDLAAHELAHVWQHARGITINDDADQPHAELDGEYWGSFADLEQDADWAVQDWGFNPDGVGELAEARGWSSTMKSFDDCEPTDEQRAYIRRLMRTIRAGDRACWMNCQRLILACDDGRLEYCEGLCMGADGRNVNHAWLLLDGNCIVDPTPAPWRTREVWEEPHPSKVFCEYVGKTVDREVVAQSLVRMREYGPICGGFDFAPMPG